MPNSVTTTAIKNRWYLRALVALLTLLLTSPVFAQTGEIDITGELKKWHPVTLTLDGPFSTETSEPNPFLDYRMIVTFTNGGTSYVVPGFFAADGDAANTSATSGTKWRARFTPDLTGTWNYTISFREGDDVAISDSDTAGAPNAFDGTSGSFTVSDTDKTGKDFRARGILRHVGEHYLQFDSGEWFITTGTGSPENFFGYAEFDNTFPSDNWPPIKTYPTHIADWNTGDPTWGNEQGKGIIGAINYLSGVGVNSFYIMIMNTQGDGKETFPWIAHEDFLHFDVSKMAQWNIVFEHMNRSGIMPHLILQEMGNEKLLDNGDLGTTRTLFYRELLARFSHLNAIKWNIGEEHGTPDAGGNTDAQRLDYVNYLTSNEPYGHPVVMHTSAGSGNYNALYTQFLGHPEFGGMSYHIHGPDNGGADSGGGLDTYKYAREWYEKSEDNGRKWIITLDECCGWDVGVKPDQSNIVAVRKDEMWGTMMAGGSGFDWYLGFDDDNRDLTLEDFRIYEFLWELSANTGDFFREYVPFVDMAPVSDLTPIETNRVFAKPGEVYVVFLRDGGTTTLDLEGSNDTFIVEWFNPRTGGDLLTSNVTEITGPGVQSIGSPPSDTGNDWVALVRGSDAISPITARFTSTSSDNPFTVDFDASTSTSTDAAITSYSWAFGDGSMGSGEFTSHTYAAPGLYTVTLTITDALGNSDDQTQTVDVDDPNATGAFLEQDGLLVIEAENYEDNISRNGQSWTESTAFSGYEGTGSMAALPDNGNNYSTGYGSTSPYINLFADFTNTGTYYVWVRMRAVSSGNTLHVGLNATETPSAEGLESNNFSDWEWVRTRKSDGGSATLSIDNPGQQNITVFFREDGTHIDRLVMTTDPNFVPTGGGPAESPRASSAPTAVINADATSGQAPLAVSFDGSDSSAPIGSTLISYDWDFGDGNFGTGETASHTYTADGSFTATLTVTDSNGNTATATETITVEPAPVDDPVAIIAAIPTSGVVPLNVAFDGSGSTPPDGATLTEYAWDFGDSNSGTGETTSHTYTTEGTFTATLTVTDSNGNSDSATQTITVNSDTPPGDGAFIEVDGLLVIEAEHYEENVTRNGQTWTEDTAFTGFVGESAMAALPDNGEVYANNYGTTSPFMNFLADFTNTGTYYVWVRVRPVAAGNTIHVGLDETETSSSEGIGSNNAENWTWTNSTRSGSASMEIDAVGEQFLTIWMRDDGIQIDRFLLTTDANFTPTGDGPSESERSGDTPTDTPVAAFTATPTSGHIPLEVSFDASTSTPPDGATLTDYSWDFGDGNTASGETTSHTYDTAGTFTVVLTITDSNGNTDTVTSDITATDPSAEDEMHVSAISTVIIRGADRTAFGQATVTVVDQNGNAVSDATVSGTFSGDVDGNDSGATGGEGMVTLASNTVTERPFIVEFCVDDITHASLTYNPGANIDPDFACTLSATSQAATTHNLVLKSEEQLLPTEYAIENYPNPFNPTTTIRMDLPEGSWARLKVYNVLGQGVATLVDEYKEAGTYQILFDARALSNGLYVYILETEDFKASRVMILAK